MREGTKPHREQVLGPDLAPASRSVNVLQAFACSGSRTRTPCCTAFRPPEHHHLRGAITHVVAVGEQRLLAIHDARLVVLLPLFEGGEGLMITTGMYV